jgi:hypothetical protein
VALDAGFTRAILGIDAPKAVPSFALVAFSREYRVSRQCGVNRWRAAAHDDASSIDQHVERKG